MKHTTLHTGKYYTTVNAMLVKATSKSDALAILDDIAEMLQNGKFPK